ncbi:MAG: hypothetical protein IPJ61_20385 [Tessaracoccus sp.]|uniref:hypothetical protein n=1 Tax=Tessaracoccus sp. TaxID=1971211 RepID=UPI001EC3CE10|nr:hypothetical protein [Tessaracoccus sp.]MBK7823347.1 hypothetical protein [Tessaracoccus sp.]
MALLSLGDSPVLSGSITRPLRGAWSADLEVDADAAPTGTLTLSGASLSLVGTVVTSQSWNDRQRCRIVGGKNGMGRTLGPAWFRSTTLRTVVAATLTAAGETLSPTSDAATLALPVVAWARLRSTAAASLETLLALYAPAALWRVLPDGSVYVGPATWPTVTSTAVVQDNRGDEDVADLAGEDLSLDAGVTVSGRRVGLARHRIRPQGLRSEAWWYTDTERGLAAVVRSLVERIVGPRLDLLAAYPATVVSQNADGTLELRPSSSKVPAVTKVPIRYGVPGITAKVSAGARVWLEFAGGDASQPVATLWESASVTELDFSATLIKVGGSRPLVRQGDPVMVMLGPTAAAKIVSGGVGTGVPLSGYVLLGSSKVKGG